MAKCRKGMVWRPRVTNPRDTPARRENRDAKATAAARKKGGPISKMLKRAAVAQQLQRRRAIKSKKKVMKAAAAKKGGGSLIRTVGRAASLVRMANPWGLIITAVATAGIFMTRILTGRSFENMGQQVRKAILGDIPEEAVTDVKTRAQIASPEVMAAYSASGGEGGGVHGQLKKIFEMQRVHNLAREKGRRAFERSKEFQVNAMSDIVVLKLHAMWVDAWNGSGAAAEYAWVEYLIAFIKQQLFIRNLLMPFGITRYAYEKIFR